MDVAVTTIKQELEQVIWNLLSEKQNKIGASVNLAFKQLPNIFRGSFHLEKGDSVAGDGSPDAPQHKEKFPCEVIIMNRYQKVQIKE